MEEKDVNGKLGPRFEQFSLGQCFVHDNENRWVKVKLSEKLYYFVRYISSLAVIEKFVKLCRSISRFDIRFTEAHNTYGPRRDIYRANIYIRYLYYHTCIPSIAMRTYHIVVYKSIYMCARIRIRFVRYILRFVVQRAWCLFVCV